MGMKGFVFATIFLCMFSLSQSQSLGCESFKNKCVQQCSQGCCFNRCEILDNGNPTRCSWLCSEITSSCIPETNPSCNITSSEITTPTTLSPTPTPTSSTTVSPTSTMNHSKLLEVLSQLLNQRKSTTATSIVTPSSTLDNSFFIQLFQLLNRGKSSTTTTTTVPPTSTMDNSSILALLNKLNSSVRELISTQRNGGAGAGR